MTYDKENDTYTLTRRELAKTIINAHRLLEAVDGIAEAFKSIFKAFANLSPEELDELLSKREEEQPCANPQ
jgi:hypothetical protein